MKLPGPVIVIDDDKDDRDIMQDVLTEMGVNDHVRMFESGRGALDYLQATAEKPFLIICDINMPSMNGLELRKRITADEVLKRKSIPFVFLSTSALEEHVEEAYDLSAHGYFVKDVSFTKTRDIFEKMFSYWHTCVTPALPN